VNGDDDGATVNEWVNVIRRARLHATTKLVALLLASYADPDGTSIFPGVARLAVQTGLSYRTIQRELAGLRAMGLIAKMSRAGMPRAWSDPYRLTFAGHVLASVDIPTPAAEDSAVENLARQHRGRYRGKTTARHPDGAQTDDCTPWDDTTARHARTGDLQERPTPSIDLSIETNPPSEEGDVRTPRTGDAHAREANGKRFISDEEWARRERVAASVLGPLPQAAP
jgi:hypothetical protein